MRDPAGWWANIGFAVCGESVSTRFTIYPSVVSSCGWLTPVLRGLNSISVHTHLHRLGTNCCFPRNFIKSIGDYKLVPSCVCWLILLPLTVISLHTPTIETQQLLHHHPTGWIIPVEGAERELQKTWPHGYAILAYLRYPPRTRVS